MNEPTPEAVEELARVIRDMPRPASPVDVAEAVLAAGYVHLISHLNSLTASERLELGDALCREAAEMDGDDDDEEECMDDTDLCEHGLRFGCADCKPELHRLMSNPPVWGDGS